MCVRALARKSFLIGRACDNNRVGIPTPLLAVGSLCVVIASRVMLPVAVGSLAFVLPRLPAAPASRRASVRLITPDSFFELERWKTLALELDAVPVFAIVTPEGSPLQTECGGQSIVVFFTDGMEADSQLSKASASLPDAKLRLLPVGLANAWLAQAKGEAQLVPGKAELRAAGAEVKGDDAVIGAVPVFGCMDLQTNRLDGTPCVPLFLSMVDAERAVMEATNEMLMTPGGVSPEEASMDIQVLSLDKAIERTVTGSDGLAFRFVAPSASLHKIEAMSK